MRFSRAHLTPFVASFVVTIVGASALPARSSPADSAQAECATLEGDFSLTELVGATADQCVERIVGNLNIESTNSVLTPKQLATLRHLTEIEGSLRIRGNSAIVDLSGLENLTDVGGLLYIGRNEHLETLDGLDNLVRVGQRLTVWGNASLGDLRGLTNLRTAVNVDITKNSSLTSLDGLEKVEFQELAIRENASLTELPALVHAIDLRRLTIMENQALQRLDGLDSLRSVESWFDIIDNPVLTDLDGLRNLEYVQRFTIGGNPRLKGLGGLENLSSTESLEISQNDSLSSLDGLQSLSSVWYLDILGNSRLESLEDLRSLNSVLEIRISGNPHLENLRGLENVQRTSRSVSILNNEGLEDLRGLDNLSKVGGGMRIAGNRSLTSLSALRNLTRVGSELQIIDNTSLVTLDGLENLTFIGSALEITGNPLLTSISALHNLAVVGRTRSITNNAALSQDAANALLDQLEEREFFSTNPEELPLLPSGRIFAGESMANVFFGDHVYFGAGGILFVAQIESADSLRVMERIPMPTRLQDLLVEGDILYALDHRSGLFLFDLSEPGQPELLSKYYLEKECYDVWAGSGNAYVSHREAGITRLDVSDPSEPRIASWRATRSQWVSGYQSYLYSFRGVADGIDILDAATLDSLGSIPVQERSNYRPLVFRDQKGMLAWYTWFQSTPEEVEEIGSVAILDMSDPLSPQQLGNKIELPGSISSMTLTGDTLFAAVGDRLVAVDVSGPDPRVLFFEDQSLNRQSTSLSHAQPYLLSSYLGYERGGVDLLHLDSSGRMLGSSNFDTSVPRLGEVYATGSYVVANDRERLYLIDVSDVTSPRIRHVYDAGDINGLHGQEDLVFVAGGTGLSIHRITEQGLELIVTLDRPSHCVEVQGSLLAADNHLFDVTFPARPRLLSSLDLSMRITAIAIRGSRLFISGSEGSYVYDIANPEQPEQIWFTPAEVSFPSAEGDHFFVFADGHLQAHSISASNEFELSVEIPAGRRPIYLMFVEGPNLFLVERSVYQSDLFVYDVSDIHNVSQTAVAHTSDFTSDIFVNDDYIVLAGDNIYIFPNNLRGPDTVVSGRIAEPHSFRLSQNFPNPFNAGTVIPFSLDEDGSVELHVYNLAGQNVAQLEGGFRQPGRHLIHWDGRDQTGHAVASGVYIFQLLHRESALTRKMVLLK